MTVCIFQWWLKAFDWRMEGCKVILLLDGSRTHSTAGLNLQNTIVHILPPYTTSRIQPMDAGIIMSFKRHYRSLFIKWLLDQYKDGSSENNLNVLFAIQFIVSAWNDITATTIFNCFCYTKILPVIAETNTNDDNADNELMNELYADIKALHF